MSTTQRAPHARKRVLVLCTGNSCRSQMAEAWINNLLAAEWEARSAGTRPAERVHPLATAVMSEVGIDLSAQRPTSVEARLPEHWDLVVTVCDDARESCPVFPRRVGTLHMSFEDPAAAEGSDEQKLAVFRRVRDLIREGLLPAIREAASTAAPEAKGQG